MWLLEEDVNLSMLGTQRQPSRSAILVGGEPSTLVDT
jgi:hypothetical protein